MYVKLEWVVGTKVESLVFGSLDDESVFVKVESVVGTIVDSSVLS